MYIKNNCLSKAVRICALVVSCLMLVSCASEKNVSNNAHKGDFEISENESRIPVKENKKRVALTFDDGPHNVRTKKIVDELDKYGFNATFFVVGNRVAAVNDNSLVYDGADAMKYAAQKGNEIGIHGYTHSVYYHQCSAKTYRNELADTKSAIQAVARNCKVNLMRPIGGNITEERVSECPYAVIMWSVDSLDWKYRDAYDEVTAKTNVQTIVNNVMSKVSNGDIILMHDIYENTYEATKIILKELYDQGYEVVTVSELFDNNLESGQKYSKRIVK